MLFVLVSKKARSAPIRTSWFIAIDFGPQSRPMNPSGTPVSIVASPISPSSPNLDEVTKSTGRVISTFFSWK
jgi:hypothetical protein